VRVIGTAGHVDHGKSTLIRALTGIDPDRLQEEKERGMTIDLGFAWLRLPSGQEVSIVDVPGHERFIKNMLAGVGGIDIALLVVAADEGVMPQTREHLAILDLLGIRDGVVAITKRDLVDEEWLGLVQAETEEVLADSTLAKVPILPVSSTTGEGLDELVAELDRQLSVERRRRQTGWPRLPIDRVFTMSGFGTVLTGTLIDGELRIGQEAELVPSGRRARIRGLQSHRKKVDAAPAGTRVAVNLSGIATDEIERGEVLTAPGWLKPTRVLDVRLRVVGDAPRPLAHNAQVTFHTGAAEALGRVGLLDSDELKPGDSGVAQIRLDRPVAAVKGDLFVVRLPSPNITIGGGTIVDEHPKRHRRFQERVLAQLAVLEQGDAGEVLVQTLQSREPADLGELAKRAASTVRETQELVRSLVERGGLIALDGSAGISSSTLLLSAQGWQRIAASAQGALEAYHGQHPLRRGMPREELRGRLGIEARAFGRIERELVVQGVAAGDGPFVRLPAFSVQISPEDEERAGRLTQALIAAGASPPGREELAARFGVSDELIDVLVDRGTLVEVAQDLVYARGVYEDIVERIRQLIVKSGPITVAGVRDSFDTSRKYALAILEHLDSAKITRRVGDERVLA
jgi:selenocysteine-specific elongation factor